MSVLSPANLRRIGRQRRLVTGGVITLVIVLMGSTMLTKTPGAARMVLSVQITDDQADGVPPYMHFDRDEWR